jgi:putative oxidoreductase
MTMSDASVSLPEEAMPHRTLNGALASQPTQRLAILYARIALGAAFLSAVGSRFGIYGENVGWGNFANFVRYTAEVNSFLPAFTIPFVAWAATVAETTLGIALILGIWPRWVALGAALLLAMFGTAMAISFGIKSPLDYSVFSASAAALLLALHQNPKAGANS